VDANWRRSFREILAVFLGFITVPTASLSSFPVFTLPWEITGSEVS